MEKLKLYVFDILDSLLRAEILEETAARMKADAENTDDCISALEKTNATITHFQTMALDRTEMLRDELLNILQK